MGIRDFHRDIDSLSGSFFTRPRGRVPDPGGAGIALGQAEGREGVGNNGEGLPQGIRDVSTGVR